MLESFDVFLQIETTENINLKTRADVFNIRKFSDAVFIFEG